MSKIFIFFDLRFLDDFAIPQFHKRRGEEDTTTSEKN